jgi:hypothetical protein
MGIAKDAILAGIYLIFEEKSISGPLFSWTLKISGKSKFVGVWTIRRMF